MLNSRMIDLYSFAYDQDTGLGDPFLIRRLRVKVVTLYTVRTDVKHLSMENKLAVPLLRTNFLKNSFSYNGAVIWNSLSPELRQAKSLKSFRNGCRDFFD